MADVIVFDATNQEYGGIVVVDPDLVWDNPEVTFPVGIPAGGAEGQVLAKISNESYAVGWIDPPEGGGGTDPGGEEPGEIIEVDGGGPSSSYDGDIDGGGPETTEFDNDYDGGAP